MKNTGGSSLERPGSNAAELSKNAPSMIFNVLPF
jgi:hypothetical protein